MPDIDLSQVDELADLKGATVLASDGEKIGKIDQVWVDNVNNQPEWAAVKTGLLKTTPRYVPLRAADFGDGEVTLAYTKREVEASPDFDPATADQDQVVRLYRHYRQPLPAPPPPKIRNPFDRMTAVWVPGVTEKIAEITNRFKK